MIIELSNKKHFDNTLANALVEKKKEFFKPIKIEEILNFMIKI